MSLKPKFTRVAEGKRVALKFNIDMPITEQTYKVLYEQLDPLTAVENLLSRETKSEY